MVSKTLSLYIHVIITFNSPVVPESDVHFNNETLFSFPISSASLSTQCHRVDIVDDEILENTEYFEGILTKGPVSMPRLTVGIDDIRVAITDNDMVTIGFTQTEVIVNEDDEQRIELCAELVGEIGKEVSVSVSSQPGTADGKSNWLIVLIITSCSILISWRF